MDDSAKAALKVISILISLIGLIISVLQTSPGNRISLSPPYQQPYQYPEKKDDHLEEAMARLNEKKISLPKDVLLDTIYSTLDSGSISFEQILPYSRKNELITVHQKIKNELTNQIEAFVETYAFNLPKSRKKLIHKIEIVPYRLFRNDQVLSYVMKVNFESDMDILKGDNFSIFNYDLRTNEAIMFKDFFEFGKTKNDGDFLEILTGKKNWYEAHDLQNLKDVIFYFNQEYVYFDFDAGQYPFTHEQAKQVKVRIPKLKNFIRAKYYPQAST